MTKKHYIAIARIIQKRRQPQLDMILDSLSMDMADYFQEENPLFDRTRFLTACDTI